MTELQDTFPYWQYSAILDGRTRPSHKALHGKIFKATDHEYYPPIGHRCRCTAIPLTARQAGKEPKENIVGEGFKPPLDNAQFIGNKQQSFIKWLQTKHAQAEPATQLLIATAIEDIGKFLTKNTIAIAKEKYDKYNPKEWNKIKFNDQTGAYIIEHQYHKFNKQIGGQTERKVGEILYNLNKQVEFLDEYDNKKSPDLKFDNQTWDIKTVVSYTNRSIADAIYDARKAENVIFYFTKNINIDLIEAVYQRQLANTKKYKGKIPNAYYINAENKLVPIKKE